MRDDRIVGWSEAGTAILRYGKGKTSVGPARFNRHQCLSIGDHIRRHVGEVTQVFHEDSSEFVHVDVYHVPPRRSSGFHALITAGMSYLPMKPPEEAKGTELAELVALLPGSWDLSLAAFRNERNGWPIRLLKEIARFPHQHDAWISCAHTFSNGDPPERLAPNVGFKSVILLPPMTLGPDFFVLNMGREKSIRFLAIVPLYEEELEYKLEKGLQPLLARFDGFGIRDVIDIHRVNVCRRRRLQPRRLPRRRRG